MFVFFYIDSYCYFLWICGRGPQLPRVRTRERGAHLRPLRFALGVARVATLPTLRSFPCRRSTHGVAAGAPRRAAGQCRRRGRLHGHAWQRRFWPQLLAPRRRDRGAVPRGLPGFAGVAAALFEGAWRRLRRTRPCSSARLLGGELR